MVVRKWTGQLDCLLLLLALGTITRLAVAGEDPLRVRFLQEAPVAWNKLLTVFDDFEVRCTYRIIDTHRGKTVRDQTNYRWYSFRRSEGFARTYRTNPQTPSVAVEATNPSYSFTVQRQDPRRSFWLRDYGASPQRIVEFGEAPRFNTGYLDASFFVEPFPLWQMLEHPDFRMDSITEVSVEGESLVRVDWTWRNEANPQGDRISVFLDPTRLWALHRWTDKRQSSDPKENHHRRVQIDYQETENGMPFPRVVEDVWVYPFYDAEQKVIVEFDRPTKCSLDNASFYLPAYGLSPPEGSVGVGSLRFWVMLVAAIVLCGLILYRRRRKRRQGREHNGLAGDISLRRNTGRRMGGTG